MIAAFIETKHTTWDEHIPEFALTYNIAIHESSRSSPAFLNYGRNPTAQKRQEKYYNAKHRDIEHKVGEKVWARNRILSSAAQAIAAKLSLKYADPFIVSARVGMKSYKLQTEQGVDIGKVAVYDLKPCHDEEQFPGDTPESHNSDSTVPEPPISPKERKTNTQLFPNLRHLQKRRRALRHKFRLRLYRSAGADHEETSPNQLYNLSDRTMLPVKKPETIIKMPDELLEQIEKLVAEMILAQTSQISPTLSRRASPRRPTKGRETAQCCSPA
ncbi:hypothetical protein TSAR_001647 [Trichomalopsis sarcophagae]|uniref:Integrase catalytic domain-containing protein n=1 Tax=Trichomalopsis sarcophagae TaxID=543379 RepID=A0A232EDQ4_9HYME|nr:hypothetical protein TSAR_001647 [Trichomalopsis sarcophagae]